MNLKTSIIVITTTVALLGTSAAIYEYIQTPPESKALADAERERDQLRNEIGRLRQTAASPHGSKPQSEQGPAQAAPPGGDHNPMGGVFALLANPRFAKMSEISTEISLDRQYGGFFKSLNLTDAQIEQVKKLLAEQRMVMFDTMVAAHDQGIDPRTDPNGFFQAVKSAQSSINTEIGAVIGQDGYAAYQAYQGTVPARNTIQLLQQSLGYTADPITEQQATALVPILSGAPQPFSANNPFFVLNQDMGLTSLNEQTLTQLQGILSPAQVQAFQNVVKQQGALFQARQQAGP
ncbi:MAG TPA: hypothetical protein VGL42_14930 [Opitutaceae bacterium]|jgi:hypothetical protein